jgi:chemotaxis signal transduction protein
VAEQSEPLALLEQIRRLEGELAESWKRLGDQRQEQLEQLHALEVTVAERTYLVPTFQIREVVAMVWPQPLTGAPEWVLGVFSYGSVAVPLIDLTLRLDGRPSKLAQDLFVVVVDQPRWLGLVVSAVGRVLEIEAGSITSPGPEIPRAAFLIGALQASGGEVVHLLSVASLGREIDEYELPDQAPVTEDGS